TTNAGVTWTDISSNLPSVPAYALVVDPIGRLFVGTEVGVYASSDGGGSWQRFGQGLPNVPVVDLEFNAALGTLAAATQGRGAFTIADDFVGPRVVAIAATGPGPTSAT